jgi:hypothetical protein
MGERERAGYYTLAPAEAAKRAEEDPDNVYIGLSELMRGFGITFEELRPDLVSGKLVAVGDPTDGGYRNVSFRVSDVVRWMALTGHSLAPTVN